MADIKEILTEEERVEYGDLLMSMTDKYRVSDVILNKENTDKLNKFLAEQEKADELLKYGLFPMCRLLFQGESGTGKSMLAKALALDLDRYLLYIDISQALSDAARVSKNIAKIFKLSAKYSKENGYKGCILFFDEFDSIALSRDSASNDGGDVRRALNSTFLYLDQMVESNPTTIFIACTNLAFKMDRAIKTRFDTELRFKKPDASIMSVVRKFVHDEFKIVDDASEQGKKIIDSKNKASYRELRSIINSEMKHAVINGSMEVKSSDIYRAIAQNQKIKIKNYVIMGTEPTDEDEVEEYGDNE